MQPRALRRPPAALAGDDIRRCRAAAPRSAGSRRAEAMRIPPAPPAPSRRNSGAAVSESRSMRDTGTIRHTRASRGAMPPAPWAAPAHLPRTGRTGPGQARLGGDESSGALLTPPPSPDCAEKTPDQLAGQARYRPRNRGSDDHRASAGRPWLGASDRRTLRGDRRLEHFLWWNRADILRLPDQTGDLRRSYKASTTPMIVEARD